MPKLRLNLTRPPARWEVYSIAIVFVVVVWQFGHLIDRRHAAAATTQSTTNTRLENENTRLITAAHKQRQLNASFTDLRNAVCIIFDGIPAPSRTTQFGKLWHRARKEAHCHAVIVVHAKPPAAPSGRPQPTTTVTVTPHPASTGSPRPPKPHKKHHKSAPDCVLPTSMVIKCVPPPSLAEAEA